MAKPGIVCVCHRLCGFMTKIAVLAGEVAADVATASRDPVMIDTLAGEKPLSCHHHVSLGEAWQLPGTVIILVSQMPCHWPRNCKKKGAKVPLDELEVSAKKPYRRKLPELSGPGVYCCE